MYIYRGDRWGKEKRHKVGWKESGKERGRLYVGKEPKEPLGSAEEIRQKEKGEAGQKHGRNQ